MKIPGHPINDNCIHEDEMFKNYINSQKVFNNEKSIRFLKTHSCFVNTKNFRFTDRHNTLGVIYIVRDPRSILSSLTNLLSRARIWA